MLTELIKAGSIRIVGCEYIGLASDGTEVLIGTVGKELDIESYLEVHPTPDTW